MPRYFFDLHDGVTVHDEHGLDLSDIGAVRIEAHRALVGMAAQVAEDTDAVQIRVDVRDEIGDPVLRAALLMVSEPYTKNLYQSALVGTHGVCGRRRI